MTGTRIQVLLLVPVWFLIGGSGMAQVPTAHLEGRVQDASGAVVPGAKVSALNTRTHTQVEIAAGGDGRFVFPSLQPSIYMLTVEAPGFRQTVVSNLELDVASSVSQTVAMEVGAVTESVTVTASEVRVQTTDAQISRATTLRDIDVLPQLSRAPVLLAVFNSGIQIDGSDVSLSRVNGGRQGAGNLKLDGIDINDAQTPRLLLGTAPSNTDSVEEFRIVTSGGKAEYGRSPGAQIEMITRSGSNTIHGNAFEYLRNTALNANSFFNNASGLDRPVFNQNTFGGSFGGPLWPNHTFVFGNFQGKRTSVQVTPNRLVLTAPARAGVFQWRSPGSTQINSFDILHGDPSGRGMDPKVAAIIKLLPAPNNPDIGDGLNTAGFRFNTQGWSGGGLDDRSEQVNIKVDHNLWNGHRVFFRWNWSNPWFTDSLTGNEARYPGQPAGTQGGKQQGWSLGSDCAITGRLVNEVRAGNKYYQYDFLRPARLPGPMLLANSWADPLNPAFGQGRQQPVYQVTDNLTQVRGKHTLKGGFELRFTRQWSYNNAGMYPNVAFTTGNNNSPAGIGPNGASVITPADRKTFENLYNDLLGRVGQVTQTFYSDLRTFQPAGTPRLRDQRFHEYAGFFQDDWKLHSRLVLNAGLRWEFFGTPSEANGLQGTLDKAPLVNQAARIDNLTMQRSGQWYNNDFNNFAPRIGLAWDITGNGKTALRANWGIFYDRLIGATSNFVDNNTPGFSQAVLVYPNLQAGSDFRASDVYPLPQQPAAPVLSPPATRSIQTIGLFAPNLRTGYVQDYSLTLQREILPNTVIDAGYVGTRGIKLFMDLDLNQPRIYQDFLGAFRELQAFRANGTAVSPSNTLVRMFGTPAAAITGIGGANVVDQGAVGTAADSLDRLNYAVYAKADVSNFYLRNFPQFVRVVAGTNDGRSYYDSFQLTLRRQAGALKFVANYTFSKSIDNISAEGNSFTSPIDNYNVRLNRSRGDYDIPHTFNASLIYTLPIGKGRRFAGNAGHWVDAVIGGWDVGLLTIWQSGRVVTYTSGLATGPSTVSTWANYTGDRNIGQVMRRGDGVYWLTADELSRFSSPAGGDIGTGGRNAFRGPKFFDADMSLVKKFRIAERVALVFRAEAYNLFNNANFATPNLSLATLASFGKISSTVGNARILQMALRCEF